MDKYFDSMDDKGMSKPREMEGDRRMSRSVCPDPAILGVNEQASK